MVLHDRIPGAKLFAKYSKAIDREFSTTARNPSGRPSRGREILRAYKQGAVSNEDVIELALYYVSAVLNFMEAFGIDDDVYFNAVESGFREAAEVTVVHAAAVRFYQLLNLPADLAAHVTFHTLQARPTGTSRLHSDVASAVFVIVGTIQWLALAAILSLHRSRIRPRNPR